MHKYPLSSYRTGIVLLTPLSQLDAISTPTKLSFSTVQLLGNLFFEAMRGCLQKHAIAEIMAPLVLVGSSRTSTSNKSWRVEDFFDVLVRGIRVTLGGRYLPSIFTSSYTFLLFVCEWSPPWEVLSLTTNSGMIPSSWRAGQNGNEIYVKFCL